MKLDIVDRYNKEAYEKVKNTLKTTNIATVIHPDFTRIEDIGVKFLDETTGKTLCLESGSKLKKGKIQQKVERMISEGKISKESLTRYDDVEFISYSELMERIKREESISGYENLVLSDLWFLGQTTWKNGIDVLLDRNNQAKTLQLVEYSPVELRSNNALLQRVKGNIASFISEKEATKKLSYYPLEGEELIEAEEEIKILSAKVSKLQDKELRKRLRAKIKEARILCAEWRKRFTEESIDFDEIDRLLYRDDDDDIMLTDEEMEEKANRNVGVIETRDKIREILNSIRVELGLGPKISELEALRQEYERLSEKEDEARKLLGEIETERGEKEEGEER